MNATTKERIGDSQRQRWVERKAAARQLEEQAVAMEATNKRLLWALYSCAAALEPYRDSDRLAAFALEELEAAQTAVQASNIDRSGDAR